MPALTLKQQRFVDEYLMDLNATQAATRAGYSAKTANEQGARLLANVSVAEAVRRALADRSDRTTIDADMVLGGLLIEAKREGEGSSHGARVAAWSALGKHLGMFVEKSEIKHAFSYEDALAALE